MMFVLGYFGRLFNPVSNMPSPLCTAARVLPNFHRPQLGLALLDGQSLGLVHWLVLLAYTVVVALALTLRRSSEELRGLGLLTSAQSIGRQLLFGSAI
jgi:hypothetical protein